MQVMTSVSMKRKGRNAIVPRVRIVLSTQHTSPPPEFSFLSTKSKASARWFRSFRTMDSSPLRLSAFRDSPLLPRTTHLKSIGVRVQMAQKDRVRPMFRSFDSSNDRDRKSIHSELEVSKRPSLLSNYLQKPKRFSELRPPRVEDYLTPWED